MKYVIGALVGIAWGCVAALINGKITKTALEKNSNKAMMGANAARTAIDIVALGLVFLLRKVLPFSFEACIVGTAAGMSLLMIYLSFRMIGKK